MHIKQQTKPKFLYSTRLPEGDIVCNDPAFLREALEGGYKVRKLSNVRQLWETGSIVTMESLEESQNS